MAMCYTYTFICDLRNGCGAVIEIRTDRFDGHPYITCPICTGNCVLKGKK